MNRMVYALFTPWLLPKIKHAFPMSSPSFVPSSIVSRPSHWMIRHRFPLSDSDRVALGARKQGANGNPSETWSWFVTTDKDARLRGSLFLFHQTLLSYPFCRFSPRFGRWLCEGLMAASEVRSNLEAWPSTNPEVWTLAKGPRVPIWSLALGGAVLNDREAGKKILLKHSRNVVYFLLGDGKFRYPLVSSPWSENSTSFSTALVSVGLL